MKAAERPLSPRSGVLRKKNNLLFEDEAIMYCPYCGAPLVLARHGELRCSSTGALFSRHVGEQLESMAFTDGISTVENESHAPGFHCPKCGSKTGKMRCADCGATLSSRLVHEIVELNPHMAGPAG
jgi:DNA-directed RNA polymerase subunit RPC12/RpoP